MRDSDLCRRLVLCAALLVSACGLGGPGGARDSGPTGRAAADPARANNLARRLNLRGCVTRDLNDFDSAMVCFREALELGERHQLKHRVYASLLGIAVTYAERPYHYRRFDYEADMDSAETYFQRAYALCQDSGMSNKLPSLVGEMAAALFRDPKHQHRADSLFRVARSLARRESSALDEGITLFHQAKLHGLQAIAACDLSRLKAAMFLMDTAAILLHRARHVQTAGSAEEFAEDIRARIARFEEAERGSRGE